MSLLGGLDPFGNVHLECVRQLNHSADHFERLTFVSRAYQERTVQLEGVERELVQVAERREPGAEVVYPPFDLRSFEPLQNVEGVRGIRHHDAFGRLEFERLGRQAGVPQHLHHTFVEHRRQELLGRHVDVEREFLEMPLPQRCHLRAGAIEHPAPQFEDEPGLLGHLDHFLQTALADGIRASEAAP